MRFKSLKIGKRSKRYGRKLTSNKKYQDSKYYCKVCGFVCDTDTTEVRSVGTKKANTWAQGNADPTTDSDGDYIPNITGGCPFCGSPNSR